MKHITQIAAEIKMPIEQKNTSSAASAEAILDRIKSALGLKNDSQLSERLNVPYSTLASWKRRNSIPLDEILKFSSTHGYSLDWLILGDESKKPRYSQFTFDNRIFDYALAFALEMDGLDYKNYKDIGGNIRQMYPVVEAHFEQLTKAEGKPVEEAKKSMEVWLENFAVGQRARFAQNG